MSPTTATAPETASPAPWRTPDPDAAASTGFAPIAAASSEQMSSREDRRNSASRGGMSTYTQASPPRHEDVFPRLPPPEHARPQPDEGEPAPLVAHATPPPWKPR